MLVTNRKYYYYLSDTVLISETEAGKTIYCFRTSPNLAQHTQIFCRRQECVMNVDCCMVALQMSCMGMPLRNAIEITVKVSGSGPAGTQAEWWISHIWRYTVRRSEHL